MVCICNMVSENEILVALKNGATATFDIQQITRAGTKCGKCLVVIDVLVEKYLAEFPTDSQQKINFDF